MPLIIVRKLIRTSFKDYCHDQCLEKELFIVNPWNYFPVWSLGRIFSFVLLMSYFILKGPYSASWRDHLSSRMLILNPYCPSSEKQRLLWRHVIQEKKIIPTLIFTLLRTYSNCKFWPKESIVWKKKSILKYINRSTC